MPFRNRSTTVQLLCPECESTLTATVRPPTPRTFEDPGDAAEIQDLVGCVHVGALLDDDAFYDLVMEALEE